jgi:hypothetical protein
MRSNSLVELDRAHLVHPVVSWRGHEAAGVRVLTSAKGAIVTDAEGRNLVDGFAGLWCVNVGYGQESVIAAAERQLRVLPYATSYFGFGSEPAIRLAARLAELSPGNLDHVYFTLGGSDAVDSSVRFIRYYWNARGKPQKNHFISIEQGYHGSTTVGAGLTALPVFHAGFGVPYDWQHKIPSHYAYRNPADHLPSRGLPLLYLCTGLLSLGVAFATVAVDPAGIAGFFYHPRMLAVVHLVTLGWIGGSVMGSIHIVGPLALRMPLRVSSLVLRLEITSGWTCGVRGSPLSFCACHRYPLMPICASRAITAAMSKTTRRNISVSAIAASA